MKFTDSFPKEMPKLVPYEPKKMPKKPIHERLGNRESICESIHTSRMKLFRPNNFKAKHSVQSRLGKGWVNPAIRERGRIALHALTSFSKNMLASDDVQGQMLLNEFTKAIQGTAEPAKKYDMNVQKEISSLQVSFKFVAKQKEKIDSYNCYLVWLFQGKELHYTCPGAFVISSDGPGLRGMVKIPTHKTGMSMNQRFA